MKQEIQLDKVDLRILEMLQENAQTRFSDMADELNVSSGTIHVRTKKLKDLKVIKGSTINMDYDALGYILRAYVGIMVDSNLMDTVVEQLSQIPEIIECTSITGRFSLFLKIACKDPRHLKQILMESVQNIDGILQTETYMTLEEHFSKPLKLV